MDGEDELGIEGEEVPPAEEMSPDQMGMDPNAGIDPAMMNQDAPPVPGPPMQPPMPIQPLQQMKQMMLRLMDKHQRKV